MDIETLKTMAEFGALGVLIFTIYSYSKTVNNHINSSNEVIRELTQVLSELKQLIQDKLR